MKKYNGVGILKLLPKRVVISFSVDNSRGIDAFENEASAVFERRANDMPVFDSLFTSSISVQKRQRRFTVKDGVFKHDQDYMDEVMDDLRKLAEKHGGLLEIKDKGVPDKNR